jgi:glycosyltransferase involved in cell wall biosynthesis
MVLRGGDLPKFAARDLRRMRRILRRADRLIAPSRFLAEKLAVSEFEIKVIPNVIDIESYKYRERGIIEPNLFWMRSFHEVYNPQMAVEVLTELRKFYPLATLAMAGVDKGLLDEVKELAMKLGAESAVRFPGFLDAAKKREEFTLADVFINTNRVDNMPVSVLEACATGLPVVATAVGGVPYLLNDGENGLLVPNEDAEAMTRAIVNLLENPELARILSNNGRKLAEKSAWENVRREWEKLFDEILTGKAVKSSTRIPADFKTDFAKKI